MIEREAERMRAPLHAAGQRMACQCRARAPGLSGRARPDGSGGAKAVRPASVRQCRPAIATLARDRGVQDRMPAFEAGIVNAEWPARMQRLVAGALVDQAPQGSEIWLDGGHNAEGGARRRRGARRSRGAGVAPAGRDRRHDGEQGCERVPRQFRRADAPHHRGADSRIATMRCRRTGWRMRRARSACAWKALRASRPRCTRCHAWLTKCRRAS